MVDKVKLIQSLSYDEIVSTDKVLLLLEVYSKLYNHGNHVTGVCELCTRDYYNQIINNGIEMAINFQEIEKRTCVPAWDGLFFSNKNARHYSNEWITDEEAIQLLKEGELKEEMFTKLPDGYKGKKAKDKSLE